MSKKYLIDHTKCNYSTNGMEFSVKDAKEVEVLDIDEVIKGVIEADTSLVAYAKENNLQIIKIKD